MKNIRALFFFRLMLVCVGFIFIFLPVAEAATLFVDTSGLDRRPGDIFPVTLMVESTSRAINSISATFDFPSNLMEVVSVSKKGSIIDLWTAGPSFSNRAGTVDFEGMILDPGFKGVAGEILTINFKANKEGSAILKYLSPKISINSNQDENILEEAYSSEFLINDTEGVPIIKDKEEEIISQGTEDLAEKISTEQEETFVAGEVPVLVEVKSMTHSDPDKWYSNPRADFFWMMPDDAKEVKILVNNYASSSPKVHYEYRLASKVLEDMDDGEWYFHLQLKNVSGWGAVSHFPFNIDTTAPTNLLISSSSEAGEFSLSAEDESSGLDHYEISVDNKEPAILVAESGRQKFKIYSLDAGEHFLHVKAFDKASNTAETELVFSLTEDLSGKVIPAVAGELKTEGSIFRAPLFSGFNGWKSGFFDFWLPVILWLFFIILIIYCFVLKRNLKKCRCLAMTKLQTAEKVLNNVYSIAYDQATYLEEAQEKKKRLTVAETQVLEELKRALDEIEAEYK